MKIKNTFKTIENIRNKINPRYTASIENLEDIYKKSSEPFEMLLNAFHFGYAQGIKAAKAEIKKGVK